MYVIQKYCRDVLWNIPTFLQVSRDYAALPAVMSYVIAPSLLATVYTQVF